MATTQVVPGLWQVRLGFVNTFLLDTGSGLVLIDTGVANSTAKILSAIDAIGRKPHDLRQILVTHCHCDHAGSLAAIKRATGARAAMHPLDAAMVRSGIAKRALTAAPGLFNAFMARFVIGRAPTTLEPAEIEYEARDGEMLPCGLQAIHVPGHCAGQLAFLWPEHGGVLFAADTAGHVFGLALSPIYEDLDEGVRSLRKLAALDFEVACFGHGRPILSAAANQFKQKWPDRHTAASSAT